VAGNQVGRRRPPKPVPGLADISDRALQDTDLPGQTKEQMRELFRQLEQYLRTQNQEAYLGTPAPHTHEDDDSGGELDDGAELLAMLALQRANC